MTSVLKVMFDLNHWREMHENSKSFEEIPSQKQAPKKLKCQEPAESGIDQSPEYVLCAATQDCVQALQAREEEKLLKRFDLLDHLGMTFRILGEV